MFNFNQLTVKQNTYNSFVGIHRDTYTNEMVFVLPKGFESFEDSYNNVKKLFFSMYKTFKVFYQSKSKQQQVRLQDNKPQTKDQISVENVKGVYTFTDKHEDEVLLYSKLDVIDDIIKVYNDLEIDTIIAEVGLVDDVDYSKIDTFMNNGIFLKNHAIVVDNMQGDKNVIRSIPSDLIEIYCYIYKELFTELGEEIDNRVTEIAFNFAYKHLTSIQSLFDEYSFESTIMILKDRLDMVDKETAYKDNTYWVIFEAVEKFLYGSIDFDAETTKGFWGIDNFYSIWEDMCNYFYSKQENCKIIYCDTDIDLSNYQFNLLQKEPYGGVNVYHEKGFVNNFYIELKGNKRWMRPDLISYCKANGIPDKTTLDFFIENNTIKYSQEQNKIKFTLIDKNLKPSGKTKAKQIFDQLFQFFRKKSNTSNFEIYRKNKNTMSFNIKNIKQEIFESLFEKIKLEFKHKESKPIDVIYNIDWKYVNEDFFEGNSYKLKTDITKQLTYEFCLSNNNSLNKEYDIKSEFGIPFYNESDLVTTNIDTIHDIDIIKINFRIVQEVYLHDNRIY